MDRAIEGLDAEQKRRERDIDIDVLVAAGKPLGIYTDQRDAEFFAVMVARGTAIDGLSRYAREARDERDAARRAQGDALAELELLDAMAATYGQNVGVAAGLWRAQYGLPTDFGTENERYDQVVRVQRAIQSLAAAFMWTPDRAAQAASGGSS